LEPDEPIAPLWRTHLITVADSPDGAAQFRQVVHGSGGDTECCRPVRIDLSWLPT
jgi:hypothetical protein